MSGLPEDALIVILSALPVKSIIRFRCVCKRWLQLFRNHVFINMHLSHAIANNRRTALLQSSSSYYHRVDFDTNKAIGIELPWNAGAAAKNDAYYKLIGSCNGLLCLCDESLYDVLIYIWNPSTGEYKKICKPIVKMENVIYRAATAYGFGYDNKVDDYKLIQFQSIRSNDSQVQVYTLGSDSWKEIDENIPYHMHRHAEEAPMRYANGAIHWVKSSKEVIVSFDIAEEQTKEIQIPSCIKRRNAGVIGGYGQDIIGKKHRISKSDLGVLGEDLCISLEASPDKFDVWVMKEYGVADSWTKLFSISKGNPSWCSLRPVQAFDNNSEKIVFNLSTSAKSTVLPVYKKAKMDIVDYGNVLISIDPKKTRPDKIFDIQDIPKRFSTESYVGSLVSLSSGKATKG